MFREITLLDYSRPLAERLKARKVCGPYKWMPTKPGNGRGFYHASQGWTMDPRGSVLNLRIEGANEHISSRQSRITAYWGDNDGFTSFTPIIARLPHARGFLAGWTMGQGMAASLEPEIYETPEDAAFAAHSIAEDVAEREREYREDEDERED